MTTGDPDRLEDNNQHLIYGGESVDVLYWQCVSVTKSVFAVQPTAVRGRWSTAMVLPPTVEDNAIKVWRLGPIEVTQILSFARRPQRG